MSDKHSVLIVDSNEAFATMLQESLDQEGGYRPVTAASPGEALEAMEAGAFDLVIVDLGVAEPDGVTFVRDLRQQDPDLRLMVIPLMGEELPADLSDVEVQGVLPKPFFFPELPARVAAALGSEEAAPVALEGASPAAEPAAVPAASAPVPPPPQKLDVSKTQQLAALRENLDGVMEEMTMLFQETGAEAVILTCGGKLIAHTGRLSPEEADRLAQVADESWRTSARVAQILGREQLRFEQSVEGGEHLFYSLAVAENIILSVAVRAANMPLGMIRHHAKVTADSLQRFVGPG